MPSFLNLIRALAALTLWAGSLQPTVAEAPATVGEQYLFSAVNAERTQRGLRPLHWDEALHRAAVQHAVEMADRESISHQYAGEQDLAGRGHTAGARFSVIAENVAEAPSVPELHVAWMNSSGHRANVLDAQVDSLGIAVLRRHGQMYAVEDFGRSVVNLSLDEQERTVGSLLESSAAVEVLAPSEDTRRTCAMDTGYAGARRPGFVMRYTSSELTRLPATLRTRLASGRYRQAAVGACPIGGEKPFSAFAIAVLLYP